MGLLPPTITDLVVSAVSGNFLVVTRTSCYTITCSGDPAGRVILAGGSYNTPETSVEITGKVIRLGRSMRWDKGEYIGHSTSVRGIYDITGRSAHEIALLGKAVL